jgi:predicted nucleotidyltransferase component of viral defense system
MQGLSPPAAKIIDAFSKFQFLKDYQLIGGTALALQLNHRISEDLDFCQWVPDINKAQYGIDAKAIHAELQKEFGEVDINHLGFSQANYYISDPGVRVTFYHTDLNKPKDPPTKLIGNIDVAALGVLGGSKIYVITQRREIRDYYDILVMIESKHTSLDEMLAKGRALSRDANTKTIHKIFSKVTFPDDEVSQLQKLNPKFPVTGQKMNEFFHDLAIQIEKDHLKP